MPMPGLPAQPVIYFAIGRRQVTMTDRDEQPVIGSLQSAHNAHSARWVGLLVNAVSMRRLSGSASAALGHAFVVAATGSRGSIGAALPNPDVVVYQRGACGAAAR